MDRNIEAEAAILAGLLGFFIAGIISFALKREIIEILMAATVCGVSVFVLGYYAILLIRHGSIDAGAGRKTAVKKPQPKPAEKKTGKRIDVVSQDNDDIFKDIYRT